MRSNHEKVLSQLSEMNRVIREERSESTRLRQEAQRLQLATDEGEEAALLVERLRAEKVDLERENERILSQVFSEAEAGELSVLKQQVLQREAEVKRLRTRVKDAEDKAQIAAEAHATSDSRLASAHGERDAAKRQVQRAQAEAGQARQEVQCLEKRVATLVGDTGVSPDDLERALALVRATPAAKSGKAQPPADGGGAAARDGASALRLQDTDLSKLGLSPLAKKQVHEVLAQNNELRVALEKAEGLLAIAQRLSETLRAELDAHKRREAEERSQLQKQLQLRTRELATASKSALRHSERAAALEAQRSEYLSGRAPSAPPLPRAADEESVAGSLISEGARTELDVSPDENMFEVSVVSCSLAEEHFGGRPSTFVSLDFFQHETQATPLRAGLSPAYGFTAQYVLTVDDLFLHYLATAALRFELHQSWGVECQRVATCDVPLRELLHSPKGALSKSAPLYALPPATAEPAGQPPARASARPVGLLVFSMCLRRRIDAAVAAFMQQFPDVASLALAPIGAGSRDRELTVSVRYATDLRLRAHGLRAAPYVHFDLFDFGEQETATASGTDPRFEAEFRFGVDLDGRLSKYLQSTALRFSVLDENEEVNAFRRPPYLACPNSRPSDSPRHRCLSLPFAGCKRPPRLRRPAPRRPPHLAPPRRDAPAARREGRARGQPHRRNGVARRTATQRRLAARTRRALRGRRRCGDDTVSLPRQGRRQGGRCGRVRGGRGGRARSAARGRPLALAARGSARRRVGRVCVGGGGASRA